MTNIAILGYGKVGKAYHLVFPDALIHDPALPSLGYSIGPLSAPLSLINRECELAIVCVPTPSREDGGCDTSIVESVVDSLDTPLILIKSTCEPGTTERLSAKRGQHVVCSPEMVGEGGYYIPPKYPDPHDPRQHGFMILGGGQRDCSAIADIFLPVVGPSCRFRFMTSTEAEVTKYLENTFLAMKVTFANEMRAICYGLGANYHVVREGWLDDPRVGDSHSAAFKSKPGWGGRCLPKDTNALATACKAKGIKTPFMNSVIRSNKQYAKG